MANTEPPVDTAADVDLAARARPRAGGDPGRVLRHGHPGMDGERADRDGRARRRGRGRLLRRRPADRERAGDAPRAAVPAPRRAADRPPRGGPRALGGRLDARGRGLGGARDRRDPLDLRVDDDRPRRAIAGYEEARIHVQHLSARESVAAVEAAKAAGVAITCEATPHHLTLTDEEVRSLDAPLQDEPAAARRGRPPGADRGPPRPGRSTASPPTTLPIPPTRRRSRSRRPRWA